MKTRVWQWVIAVAIALGLLSTIGLMLGGTSSVRAANTTFIYPDCGTLQACIDNAQPGDVIQLRPGVYTESATLNKNVSLIGQGGATTELHAIPNQRVLTINDSISPIAVSTVISGLTFSGNHLTAAFCPDGCGGSVLITGTARPLLQNLMIANNAAYQGGGLWVDTGAPLVLRSVTFMSNTSTLAGGGLYAESDVQISTGSFQANQSSDAGGGAYVSGTAQLNGGLFLDNHVNNLTSAYGGGLYAADALVQGTQFVGNVATSAGCSACFGGGLYLGGGGTSSLDNVTFAANHSFFGGGLYSYGNITLTNGVIVGNSADSQGGGAYVSGLVTLYFGRFESNTSSFSGGGLYASSMTSLGTRFLNNTAVSGAGGGADVFGVVQLQTARFENNHSYSVGGGLYAGSLTGQGSWFVGNQALNGDGGGAYVIYVSLAQHPTIGLGSADLRDSFFFNNASGSSGGGLAVNTSLTLTNVTMVSNTASANGGGVYGNTDVNIVGGVYEGNVGGNGGALYAFGPLNVSSTALHGNEATGGSGGGAYANATALINGGSFLGNSAPVASGGGLYAFNQADIFNTSFISNSAGSGGGVSSDIVNLTDATMAGNWASSDGVGRGGGVNGITVTIVRGVYDSNWAESGGGAIYAAGLVGLSETEIRNNHINNGQGGGLYAGAQADILHSAITGNLVFNGNGGGLFASGPVNVQRSTFVGNQAADGGGFYLAVNGDARIVNSLFASNQMSPTLSGAALSFNSSTGRSEVIHTTIADDVPNLGNAIKVNFGSQVAVTDTIIVEHQVGINAGNGVAYEDYNLYFGNLTPWVGAVVTGTHSLYTLQPNFSNPLLNDYHLRVGSPGTEAGTLLATVQEDYDGQVRPQGLTPYPDIGYDEVGLSIQQMINNARPGSTVYVPAGDYTESLTLDRAANLIGAGADTNAPAVVHATAGSRVLTIMGSVNSSTRISGLKLTGGSLTGPCPAFCGGGVLVTGGAFNPILEHLVIENNRADFGGGLYVDGTDIQLMDSQIWYNTAAQSGGGIYLAPGAGRRVSRAGLAANVLTQNGGLIANNQALDGAGVFVQGGLYQLSGGDVVSNKAQRWGGGVLVAQSDAQAYLVHSNLIGNSTFITTPARGGGVFVDGGQAWLESTSVLSNTSVKGGGVFISGTLSARADVVNSTFISNSAQSGGGVYALSSYGITGTRFFQNSASIDSPVLSQVGGFGRIVNNFVADNQPSAGTPAIMSFGSGAQAQVFHDTFGNNGTPRGYAVAVNSGGQVTVVNTIVTTYTRGLYNAGGGVIVENYNLYSGNTADFFGVILSGTRSLHGQDPIFVDPAVGNFHIRGFSPAVNKGTNVGVRRDIDLDARPLAGAFDIGADEASVAGTNADPIDGGSFTYTTTQNTTINMILPPGAVTQTTPIYCTLVDPSQAQLGLLKLVGVIFELDADVDPTNVTPGSINFNTPVTVTVSYTDSQLAAAGITNELDLKLYRFETSVNQWEPIGYRAGETQTLDTDNNLITARLLGFSRFGQAGATTAVQSLFLPLLRKN